MGKTLSFLYLPIKLWYKIIHINPTAMPYLVMSVRCDSGDMLSAYTLIVKYFHYFWYLRYQYPFLFQRSITRTIRLDNMYCTEFAYANWMLILNATSICLWFRNEHLFASHRVRCSLLSRDVTFQLICLWTHTTKW